MQDSRERRAYTRNDIDCPAQFRIVDGDGGGAIVKNLSGGGVLLWVDRAIAPGATLRMEVKPLHDTTPPMVAEVRVLRSTPLGDEEGVFAVACQIHRVMG